MCLGVWRYRVYYRNLIHAFLLCQQTKIAMNTLENLDVTEEEKRIKKRASIIAGTVIGVPVLLILYGIFALFQSFNNIPKQTEYEDECTQAAREAIKTKLLAPSTAEFGFGRPAVKTMKVTDSTYVVKDYVDSDNAFGAKIRTHYQMKVHYYPSKSAYNYSEIEIL